MNGDKFYCEECGEETDGDTYCDDCAEMLDNEEDEEEDE